MSYSVAYIGLGTNLGNKLANLIEAKRLLETHLGAIHAESCIYETAAWGITEQPNFYNQVIAFQTKVLPLALMQVLLRIETQMGRVRERKWGERLIDLDLLLFENYIIHSPQLTLPHPYIEQRIFVLKPLVDIGSTLHHPISKIPLSQLLLACPDTTVIEQLACPEPTK